MALGRVARDGELEILQLSDEVTEHGDVVPVPFQVGEVMKQIDQGPTHSERQGSR